MASQAFPTHAGPMGLFWVAHSQKVWAACKVLSTANDLATLAAEDGEVLTCPVESLQGLAQVQDQQLEGVDDVCVLSTVNEAALLSTVRTRYSRQLIYTRVNRILISLNPFTPLPIYSAQHFQRYAAATDSLDLPPHVFGTGHDALCGLRERGRDQAIVISGESGAGKTEAAKLLLSYVAGVVRGSRGADGISGLEEQVMQTNPVLEAFGNAMTTRNNNSSRFGKWLDMRFSSALGMRGCRITSYLLEVTRVCGQMEGERGYHVFFQLLKAREGPLLRALGLRELGQYRYLRSSAAVAPGVDDSQCFEELRSALTALGFGEVEQLGVFRVAMGALALGNADFVSDAEHCCLQDEGEVQHAADLLGVSPEALAHCLLWRKVVTGKDVTATPLREEQARAVRDGLSRRLYGCLFEWLIQRMNGQLHTESGLPRGSSVDLGEATEEAYPTEEATVSGADRLLGILDISGFESFEKNSLEQLLINLSNEHLQLQFNDHVFRAELEDCAREGVHLERALAYADNADCVALLDGSGGVLDMLDEEITMPKASDITFSAKIVRGHSQHHRLLAPKFAGRPAFGIKHYAGSVQYSCEGFLEKNADRLPSEDAVALLQASVIPETRAVASVLVEQLVHSAKAKRAKSATSRFRTSLRALIRKISAADNHYVRCIKPNFEKCPARFTAPMVHEQLLYSGVLEAVRIRQLGYSSRLKFDDFTRRYSCLLTIRFPGQAAAGRPAAGLPVGSCSQERARELVTRLCSALAPSLSHVEFALGSSKVFVKASAAATLEAARARACQAAVVHLQRHLRAARVRRLFSRALPVLREIYTWMCTRSPDLSVQHGEEPSTSSGLVERLGPLETAEVELAFLASRVEQASSLAVRFGILARARNVERRLRQEVEALRCVRDLLRDCCIDPAAISEVLAQARRMGLPVAHDVLELTRRLDRLRAQLPLVEALRDLLERRDLESVPRLRSEAERLGCRAGGEGWLPELGGAELLAEAIRLEEEEAARRRAEEEARRREEEARRQREAEEAAAQRAARAVTRAPKSSKHTANPPVQATMDERAGDGEDLSGDVTSTSSEEGELDLAVLGQLAARVDTAADRIRGVPLGRDLGDIAASLRAMAEGGSAGDSTASEEASGISARLTAAAERIRGVPLGRELAAIAEELDLEVQHSRRSQPTAPRSRRGAPGSSASASAALRAELKGMGASALRQMVLRLAEEKEQLRAALQGALLDAMQREDSLVEECDALRSMASQKARRGADGEEELPQEVVRENFVVAMEEEARAARAARAHLVAENAKIKSELAAEQVALRVLRAELAAVRTLSGNSRKGKQNQAQAQGMDHLHSQEAEELRALRTAHAQLAEEHARTRSELVAERAAARSLRSRLAAVHAGTSDGPDSVPLSPSYGSEDEAADEAPSGGSLSSCCRPDDSTASTDTGLAPILCEGDTEAASAERPLDVSASYGRKMNRPASFARHDFVAGGEQPSGVPPEEVLNLCLSGGAVLDRQAARLQEQQQKQQQLAQNRQGEPRRVQFKDVGELGEPAETQVNVEQEQEQEREQLQDYAADPTKQGEATTANHADLGVPGQVLHAGLGVVDSSAAAAVPMALPAAELGSPPPPAQALNSPAETRQPQPQAQAQPQPQPQPHPQPQPQPPPQPEPPPSLAATSLPAAVATTQPLDPQAATMVTPGLPTPAGPALAALPPQQASPLLGHPPPATAPVPARAPVPAPARIPQPTASQVVNQPAATAPSAAGLFASWWSGGSRNADFMEV